MRLTEKDLLLSSLLLKQLTDELTQDEVRDFSYAQLGIFIDQMEAIKKNMQVHWLKYKQIEVVEQMIGFDVLINYVRALQTNKDVASM